MFATDVISLFDIARGYRVSGKIREEVWARNYAPFFFRNIHIGFIQEMV